MDEGKLAEIRGVFLTHLSFRQQDLLECHELPISKSYVRIAGEVIRKTINEHRDELGHLLNVDFPLETVLMGRIGDTNQFFFALTPEAIGRTMEIIKLEEERRQERLEKCIKRPIRGKWSSLGSEDEIEIPRKSRGLLSFRLSKQYSANEIVLRLKTVEDLLLREKGSYTEIVTTDKYRKDIVWCRRYSRAVQAIPETCEHGVQSELRYPEHTWTQYKFAYDDFEISEEFTQTFQDKLNSAQFLYETLLINSHINLHTSDYERLKPALEFQQRPYAIDHEELLNFKDVTRCMGRTINAFCWCDDQRVAVAYSRTGSDFISPILVWNLKDNLKPQLMLECHSEAVCLDHHENYLIAGCDNGRVLLWYLKFQTSSNRYTEYLYFLLNWPQQVTEIPILKPVAFSKVEMSHRGQVVHVQWTKKTVFSRRFFVKSAINQLEFVSVGAEDKTVKFWMCPTEVLLAVTNLKKSPTKWSLLKESIVRTKGFRKNMPMIQPFNEVVLNFPVRCMIHAFVLDIKDELISACSGTLSGDLAFFRWHVNKNNEQGHFEMMLFSQQFHDGPIVRVENINNDVWLSVGGKVFNIWFTGLLNRPAFSRRSAIGNSLKHNYYTDGFCVTEGFAICRTDNHLEIWDLRQQSHTFIHQVVSLEAAISGNVRGGLLALSDKSGTLRIINVPDCGGPDTEPPHLAAVVEKSAASKSNYDQWSIAWAKRHAAEQLRAIEELKLEELKRVQTEAKRKLRAQNFHHVPSMKGLDTATKKPSSLITEQTLIKREQEYTLQTILNRKRLNKEAELALVVPLKEVDERECSRKYKQKAILTRADHIFASFLAVTFPQMSDLCNKQLPYSKGEKQQAADKEVELLADVQKNYEKLLLAYDSLEKDADDFISANRYYELFILGNALNNKRQQLIEMRKSFRRRHRK